jgi:hypothetical protein
MTDPGRREYYGVGRYRRRPVLESAENEQLVARLSQLAPRDLVRWCDLQLRFAPASEMLRLLISACGGDPRREAA